jgi:hypothetical protein
MTVSITTRAIRTAASALAVAGLHAVTLATAVRAQPTLPAAIASPGAVATMTVHAVGAQIYECKADAAGKRGWQFREPIATLLIDGRTVGRHFAGPSWELADGSLIAGKVTGRASGATTDDIAWLKLEPASGPGSGQFASVTIIQRINTKGGELSGACDNAGQLIAVPYAGDYVFLTKGN